MTRRSGRPLQMAPAVGHAGRGAAHGNKQRLRRQGNPAARRRVPRPTLPPYHRGRARACAGRVDGRRVAVRAAAAARHEHRQLAPHHHVQVAHLMVVRGAGGRDLRALRGVVVARRLEPVAWRGGAAAPSERAPVLRGKRGRRHTAHERETVLSADNIAKTRVPTLKGLWYARLHCDAAPTSLSRLRRHVRPPLGHGTHPATDVIL